MNIAFFGTSDRSIPILEGLKNSNFNLALCVTKEDVKVGRKQELKPTAVKQWAENNRVQCVTLKSLDTQSTLNTAALISELNIELAVVADFSFLIPEKIINTPRLGIINVHFSLLPHYRGAAPVQFAILNGDEKTGITYQKMVKKMDEGPVIYQHEYELNKTETTDSLYSTLFEISGNEIADVLEKYVSGEYMPKEQDSSQATYTYSPSNPKSTQISKNDARIDWSKSPEEIFAAIRAFYPWPIAWTTFEEFKRNIDAFDGVEVKIIPDRDPNKKIGEKRVKIYEAKFVNDKIKPTKIQIEGKSAGGWDEFLNGYIYS